MNIFNSLLAQLVKYDVHTTRKINSIHAIFYHILSFSLPFTPKFELATPHWEHVQLTWRFNAVCRIVPITCLALVFVNLT